MGGIGPLELTIILVIVILLFGTQKLRSMGGDLGKAIRSFRKELRDDDPDAKASKDSDTAAAGNDPDNPSKQD